MRVNILILAPPSGGVLTGNRCTAAQWADQLRGLGHEVEVSDTYQGAGAELLIALHADKSHAAISAFRQKNPDGKIVVVVTGTDIYPALGVTARDSLGQADRIVALQSRARDRVPAEFHDKLRVIVQAAEARPAVAPTVSGGPFDICVVGQLRAVKDPMRAAAATRLLPPDSRIRLRHAGGLLDSRYEEEIKREQAENDRYCWLGELSPDEAARLMAASRLQVTSSFFEGGARVIGESIVAGTPLLAARNDAALSLLGEDYDGFFDAGESGQLAALMRRAERDPSFLDALRSQIEGLAAQFDPRVEKEALRELLDELGVSTEAGT